MAAIAALKELNQLYLDQHRIKFPSLPSSARVPKKYKLSTSNGLTSAVIDYINLTGGQAERISNTGRYLDARKVVSDVLGHERTIGTGKWIKGSGTLGTADISATIKNKAGIGLSVKLEIKINSDIQSIYQKRYQDHIEQAGGVYIIIHSLEEFINWYNEFTV